MHDYGWYKSGKLQCLITWVCLMNRCTLVTVPSNVDAVQNDLGTLSERNGDFRVECWGLRRRAPSQRKWSRTFERKSQEKQTEGILTENDLKHDLIMQQICHIHLKPSEKPQSNMIKRVSSERPNTMMSRAMRCARTHNLYRTLLDEEHGTHWHTVASEWLERESQHVATTCPGKIGGFGGQWRKHRPTAAGLRSPSPWYRKETWFLPDVFANFYRSWWSCPVKEPSPISNQAAEKKAHHEQAPLENEASHWGVPWHRQGNVQVLIRI